MTRAIGMGRRADRPHAGSAGTRAAVKEHRARHIGGPSIGV